MSEFEDYDFPYEEDRDDDLHEACSACVEEHPVDVLQEGLCPACVDDEEFEESAP